ncbi:ubiquinone biosynthesis protein UbiH [Moraxella caviae]|uniref:Ubiquinone biosynthesis protein UbiH n=1 Tax=Moraxella caviae TaxID=34060 RepID=A0A1T0ADR4_9GAMM|nr:ubiquinone biosynthesis protein UbiH [Moraxella caviae]
MVIIGGGHVGLSFALLLAHHGIDSVLVEQSVYPTISPDDDTARTQYLDSRNTALSRRTVQIYERIGLWQSLQSHACRIDSVHISELGSFGRAVLDKKAEGVESFGQVMENAWLGRQLLLAAKANAHITLHDDAKVVNITQDATSASVSVEQAGRAFVLSAPLVVACDGSQSPSRALLGIGTSTHDYNQVGIVGVVQTDKPHQHIGIEKFSEVGPLAVLPLTDGRGDGADDSTAGFRRSVVFICPKGEEARYLQDDEFFLATLQQVFGDDAGRFVQAGRRGAYPLTKILADRQVVGRCVVMGNAAHTLHPVAGQGFNLCLRDADTLAAMLAHEKRQAQAAGKTADLGDYQKLRAYEQARQKDQQRVIKFCDTVVGSFTSKNPVMKFARNVGLIAFDKIPGIKPMVAAYAMGLKS